MKTTINNAIDIMLYIDKNKSIVTLSADVWDDYKPLFEYCPYGKKYAYDGESTTNNFIDWFLSDLLESAKENGFNVNNYNIKRIYI